MHTIRSAMPDDANTIARQRVAMFQDNGLPCAATWDELERDSTVWTAQKMLSGEYVGFLAQDGQQVIGGGGVWFMEWPPHYLHLEPVRGYLLNFYVAPASRGHGLAKELVGLAIAECRRRGVTIAVLHASSMGRPIYQQLGWLEGNEMIFRL